MGNRFPCLIVTKRSKESGDHIRAEKPEKLGPPLENVHVLPRKLFDSVIICSLTTPKDLAPHQERNEVIPTEDTENVSVHI